MLQPALSARDVTLGGVGSARIDERDGTVIVAGGRRATALVETSDPPSFRIHIDDLTRGRRFLSDDVAALEAMAIGVARRIDAIRITRERFDREIREQEIGKLATEAELRALRAQINPHFLFNALTTIGYLIQTAPPRALETLLRLTTLLRSVFTSEGQFTTLGRELDVVESYLDIERARFEDRLCVSIDVPRSPARRPCSAARAAAAGRKRRQARHRSARRRRNSDGSRARRERRDESRGGTCI